MYDIENHSTPQKPGFYQPPSASEVDQSSLPEKLASSLQANRPAGSARYQAKHHRAIGSSTENLNLGWCHYLYPYLRAAQSVAAHVYDDPEMTQTKIFRFSAPLLSFLILLVMAVLLSEDPSQAAEIKLLYELTGEDPDGLVAQGYQYLNGSFTTVMAMAALCIFGVLAVWRLVIWAIAIGVRAFVQLDFDRLTNASTPGMFEMVMKGLLF
ncbi:hypothetical protein D9758_010921 [Tetrapyrgos nigripes]|uniref:Uncharacterized protein n=1 Tax=Tetrapyrgos nigripes TaxID=182062 RepID=A0A8H5CVY3_9AGAR|nr:hypothetical protein D9758_010921 [Tetrapyrgos nigripes]